MEQEYFLETGLATRKKHASGGLTSFKTLRPRRILCKILAGRAGNWNTVCDTSSGPVLHFYQVSSKYSKGYSSYRADKRFYTNANGIPKKYVPHPSGGGVITTRFLFKVRPTRTSNLRKLRTVLFVNEWILSYFCVILSGDGVYSCGLLQRFVEICVFTNKFPYIRNIFVAVYKQTEQSPHSEWIPL